MKHFILLLGMLSVFSLVGCGSPAESKKTIGYSALNLENPFFQVISDTLTQEAEKGGYSVLVYNAQSDVHHQTNQIEDFIAQKVAAIVLSPVDREGIGPAIKKANEAGIPVFTCDLQCVSEDVRIEGHVGTDNYQGGRLAGEAMIEALGEQGGKVLILHFEQANSCVLRVEGFRAVIDEHNAGRETGEIQIVSELDGEGARTPGANATRDALQAHGDLAGIFAINDPSAMGAWTAVNEVNRTDQITIVGFDGMPEGKQAIKEGKIYADPVQFPDKMGVLTIENIFKYFAGEPFDKLILLDTKLYGREQAEADPDLE